MASPSSRKSACRPARKPAPKARPLIERCWTLVGRRQGPFWHARRIKPTDGRSTSVEFDAAWALAREEARGDVVGFYHTHPSGVPEPSRRDHRTMQAWVSAFGKPLLCLIECDGEVRGYLYSCSHKTGKRLAACELLPRGIVIACDVVSTKRGEEHHG